MEPNTAPPGVSTFYIKTKRWGVIAVSKCPDGLWRTGDGTVMAYAELDAGGGTPPQVGVGIFSLPVSNPLTRDYAMHDYGYSSPAYQAFHTREECDRYARDLAASDKDAGLWRLAAVPFYYLCRIFGGMFWENKKTNN